VSPSGQGHRDTGRFAELMRLSQSTEYGERQYGAEDPSGHQWTFSETLADVAPEEWGGESVG